MAHGFWPGGAGTLRLNAGGIATGRALPAAGRCPYGLACRAAGAADGIALAGAVATAGGKAAAGGIVARMRLPAFAGERLDLVADAGDVAAQRGKGNAAFEIGHRKSSSPGRPGAA
ncbi:hypothetical protein [Pararhizobium haloflavum]|uniref:hypothetical protein n=1 Tax=Pararhizobium haloflavum TaxID=2037914 RepID=UPI000C185D46|nr:hypothetical protein [Pararhizobium haloflavum]